jgi:hypothetical protein
MFNGDSDTRNKNVFQVLHGPGSMTSCETQTVASAFHAAVRVCEFLLESQRKSEIQKNYTSFSASRESADVLWNPKVHYRIRKNSLFVSFLSQIYALHTLSSYFLIIHFSIIPPSTYGCLKISFFSRFLRQNPPYVSLFSYFLIPKP